MQMSFLNQMTIGSIRDNKSYIIIHPPSSTFGCKALCQNLATFLAPSPSPQKELSIAPRSRDLCLEGTTQTPPAAEAKAHPKELRRVLGVGETVLETENGVGARAKYMA